MMCLDTSGASELLGVSRITIWRWCKSRRLHGFRYSIHTLIPLREVAYEAGTTQESLMEEADRLDIPVWRCKEK